MKISESYTNFEELIKMYLPEDSEVKSVELKEKHTSIYTVVKYVISKEYQLENNLTYENRIMEIRLIKGAEDEGSPISSYADNQFI